MVRGTYAGYQIYCKVGLESRTVPPPQEYRISPILLPFQVSRVLPWEWEPFPVGLCMQIPIIVRHGLQSLRGRIRPQLRDSANKHLTSVILRAGK